MADIVCVTVAHAAARGVFTVRGARKVPCGVCKAPLWVSRFCLPMVDAGARPVCDQCVVLDGPLALLTPDDETVRRAMEDVRSD
jgi:hypothetical protein